MRLYATPRSVTSMTNMAKKAFVTEVGLRLKASETFSTCSAWEVDANKAANRNNKSNLLGK